jgi:tetratricopeptide (TPR) repeat protein
MIVCLLAGSGCRMAAQGQNIDGVRLIQQGQYPAAFERFKQALATDPNNPDAWYNLGATYHLAAKQQNNPALYTEAEKYYGQCLQRNYNHVECQRGLAVLMVETKRTDAAFNQLKNWVAASPNFAEAKVELARLYEEFNDPTSAQQWLTQAVASDATNGRAYSALGRLSEKSNPALALASYERALALDRNQPQLAQKVASLKTQYPAGTLPSAPASGVFPPVGNPATNAIQTGAPVTASGPQNKARF